MKSGSTFKEGENTIVIQLTLLYMYTLDTNYLAYWDHIFLKVLIHPMWGLIIPKKALKNKHGCLISAKVHSFF